MANYTELANKNEEMTVEEMIIAINQGLSQALLKVQAESAKHGERITIVEEEGRNTRIELNETNNRLEKINKDVNVLGSPIHKKRLAAFKKVSTNRVNALFNENKASCEYILFAKRFFKKIYADLAYKMSLATYTDINMEDYEKTDSQYSVSMNFLKNWVPADCYIKEVISELCETRDNGYMSEERRRALASYLNKTNNGKINPFSR